MHSIIKKTEDNYFYRRFWFSVLLNIGILIFLVVIFQPVYDTNDDFGIASLVNGARGIKDPHIVFSNYVLGLLYVALYNITTNIPWYPIIQYCCLFLSYTAITYVLINKLKQKTSVIIVTAFLTYFAYESYILIQFTRTASVATAGGMLLVLWVFSYENQSSNKIRKLQLILGILLALIGSLYRFKQFLAITALLSPIGLMILLNHCSGDSKNLLKRFLMMLGAVVLVVTLAEGFVQLDKQAYKSEEWVNYKTYNSARSQLYDHGFPSYSSYTDEYNKLGINSTAKDFYRLWNHADLSADIMSKISNINDNDTQTIDAHYLKTFAKVMARGYLKRPLFHGFLFIVLLWLIFGNKSIVNILSIGLEAFIAVAMNLYMYIGMRYLKDRVDVGIILVAAITIIWTFKNNKQLAPNKLALAILLVALAGMHYAWNGNYRFIQNQQAKAITESQILLADIESDKDHLYLKRTPSFSYDSAYTVFQTVPEGIMENVYTLGGWTMKMPITERVLENYGIEELYWDAINNDKVYIIDNDVDITIKYLHDYYSENIISVPVQGVGNYKVYKLIDE